MKKYLKTILIIAINLIIVQLTHAQISPPNIHVQQGDIFKYSYEMQINSTQSMGGNQMSSQVIQSMSLEFEVESAKENESIDILGNITNFSMSISGGGLDSTTAMAQEGPTYRLTYNDFGKETSRTLVDSANSEVAAQLNMENPSININLFLELPDKKIAPGDTWTEEKTDTVINAPFKALIIHAITKYKYEGNEKNNGTELIRITYSQEMEISGSGEMNGMQLFAEGEGASEGHVDLNKKMGILVNSEVVTEMSMNVAISGQQSFNIPMTQNIKTKQQLIED